MFGVDADVGLGSWGRERLAVWGLTAGGLGYLDGLWSKAGAWGIYNILNWDQKLGVWGLAAGDAQPMLCYIV